MKRPRLRFDQIPMWPVPVVLALGAGLIAAGHSLHAFAVLVDDAHTIEGDD